MKRVLLAILTCTLFIFSSGGQDISVTTAFDTTQILIGDQVNFSVVVEQPSGVRLTIPAFRDTLVRNIEILAGPATDTVKINGSNIRIVNKYLVTSFDSGFYRVDPIYAEIADARGIRRYYSDYSILQVSRVRITPPDTTSAIFDIAPPYRAPLTAGEILPWILLVLLGSLIIYLLIRLIKRIRKEKKEPLIPVITEPAHVIAFRELERLKSEKLWESGETKKYYIRLTEIVRLYLENRFGVNSLEMTTSETLDALVKTGFRKDMLYGKLKSVLNGADLVKFAKYKPDPAENESAYSDSWDFVEATKISDPSPEAGGEKESAMENKV